MKTALFLILPVVSHYNACFGLADQLRKNGVQVLFTGTERERSHVEAEGFGFVTMPYLEEYALTNVKITLGIFLKNLLDKTFLRNRYREFYFCTKAIERLCTNVSPTTIYIDQHLNHYFFLLPPLYRNVVLLNTKLPTRRAKGIPPLTSSLIVSNNSWGLLQTWYLWSYLMFMRIAQDKLKWLVFLGSDDIFFLKRQARRNALVYHKYVQQNDALSISLRNIPIINLVPKELESYGWYIPKADEKFLFYPYNRNYKLTTSQITLQKELRNLVKLQRQQDRAIVYASLGTLSMVNGNAAYRFLERLTEAVIQLPRVFLIISNEKWRPAADKIPPNVCCFNWVPQPELLPDCDLMITHGGMNSICECLVAGVSMLVYPLNWASDQPGNAARVEMNGWGIKGNLRRDKPEKLRRTLWYVLTNKAFVQRVRDQPLFSKQRLL